MEHSRRPLTPEEIGAPEEIELSPEEEALFLAAEEQADRDLEDVRIAMRLRRGQLDLIRRAAKRLSMPYQTYMKQAATRQAIADLRETDRLPHV